MPDEKEIQKIANANWQCERCRFLNSGLRRECQHCGKQHIPLRELNLTFTNYWYFFLKEKNIKEKKIGGVGGEAPRSLLCFIFVAASRRRSGGAAAPLSFSFRSFFLSFPVSGSFLSDVFSLSYVFLFCFFLIIYLFLLYILFFSFCLFSLGFIWFLVCFWFAGDLGARNSQIWGKK